MFFRYREIVNARACSTRDVDIVVSFEGLDTEPTTLRLCKEEKVTA